jgi:hypothetical protein
VRKDLNSLIRPAKSTERDKSVVVGIIVIETDDGIHLRINREEARLNPGQKVKTEVEESIEISQLTANQLVSIVDLVDDWLESDSHPTFFESIKEVNGVYERKKPLKRGGNHTTEKQFDKLEFRVGLHAIEVGFIDEDGWEGIKIPSSEVIDSGQPEDFRNNLMFSHLFYDFFRTRYSGPVPELELDNPVSLDRGSVGQVEHIFERFGDIVRQMKKRDQNRTPLQINDEYDVQYLLHAFLRLYFDDIRDENYLKRHAGLSPRIDFLLEDESIGIETKHVRDNHREDQIRNEIAEDKEHYRSEPNLEILLCFIYDPDQYLSNPAEFEKDLSDSASNLTTRVTITQT